jgi:hypothetical protein
MICPENALLPISAAKHPDNPVFNYASVARAYHTCAEVRFVGLLLIQFLMNVHGDKTLPVPLTLKIVCPLQGVSQ